MPPLPQSSRLKFRRADADRWAQVNPILGEGEPGFEKNTNMLKIGDGVTAWNDLPYYIPHDPSGQVASLAEHISSPNPHPVYDDGPSFALIYQNAKV